jgi:hypothetical protein
MRSVITIHRSVRLQEVTLVVRHSGNHVIDGVIHFVADDPIEVKRGPVRIDPLSVEYCPVAQPGVAQSLGGIGGISTSSGSSVQTRLLTQRCVLVSALLSPASVVVRNSDPAGSLGGAVTS